MPCAIRSRRPDCLDVKALQRPFVGGTHCIWDVRWAAIGLEGGAEPAGSSTPHAAARCTRLVVVSGRINVVACPIEGSRLDPVEHPPAPLPWTSARHCPSAATRARSGDYPHLTEGSR